MSRPFRTRHFPQALPADHCTAAYDYLKSNLQWQEGVRSRKGFMRYGKYWTPPHSHKGTCQLIVFGSGAHEILQEPEIETGRISLATFMVPT